MSGDETRHTGHGEQQAHHPPGRGADGGGHAAHAGASGPSARVQAMQERLKELRAHQAAVERERARELQEQRRHDAEAQRLMDTDPRGHIEMMRPLQERKALVRELPQALLGHEAALYLEIERAVQAEREAQGRAGVTVAPDILMAWHVLGEHWAHIAVMPLGAWLLFSPAALAYQSAALTWSDMISGALVIVFAILSMALRPWAPWANALVGLWVAFAPLAFWAPTPAEYANDTLVGTLVAAFSVIIPMRTEMPGPEVPPGWTYSPSSWPQRAPIVGLAVLSFFLARYMAAFQLGHIPAAWDPIFGRGTELVLGSDVSRAFPVSDAGLGAYTYVIELLSGLMGDARRWRTMPWMVAMFGFIVVPLGITSVVLIMLQPVAVGSWCTICLVTAVFMLIMVVLSLDEIVAMVQFLLIGHRAGKSAWRLFWAGGDLPRPVEDLGLARRPASFWTEMLWGASLPFTLAASAVLGAWVMAAPWVFGTTGTARNFESVFGALAVVVAFTAMAEVARGIRSLNVLLGLAIAVVPWFLPGMTVAAGLNDLVAGLLLTALSVPRGPVRDRYSTWDPFIL